MAKRLALRDAIPAEDMERPGRGRAGPFHVRSYPTAGKLEGNGVKIQVEPSTSKPRTSSVIIAGYSSGA